MRKSKKQPKAALPINRQPDKNNFPFCFAHKKSPVSGAFYTEVLFI